MAGLKSAPLTYCSNIHPGEGWADVMHNLNSHGLDVMQRLGDKAQRPFPLGLRIAGQAASEVDDAAVAEFREWCRAHNSYLLTINGFPYGAFHNARVKENVYLPDWREAERARYTCQLGDIAVRLQPDADMISISTVPVAFKPGFAEHDWPVVLDHIQTVLAHFVNLHQNTGVKVMLAIEAEPACVLETTDELLDFFRRIRSQLTLEENAHLGLCFDCCHQAVEFESPQACLQQLAEAEIPIAKVQVSSALQANNPEEIQRVLAFDEPVYLHQTLAKTSDGSLSAFTDLPDFQAALDNGLAPETCRVHFHIPIFLEHLGDCGTTQKFLTELLPLLPKDIPLEVETYSFAALPAHLKTDTVGQSIARELKWVQSLFETR
ncbi:metabolite traffic protein EboE [Marinimicrobium sp. ARAG 43.8]|uniref:metabolite traffic protein EboE n=1 Tax=Marinimicrobium sp. ARAG 43.8 TaxID=3418719 RepID=UPI003CF3336E